ncbi:unnamed protein product [Colias eurytheme]|nr:unnamed protein product [Colias eurytheme]
MMWLFRGGNMQQPDPPRPCNGPAIVSADAPTAQVATNNVFNEASRKSGIANLEERNIGKEFMKILGLRWCTLEEITIAFLLTDHDTACVFLHENKNWHNYIGDIKLN